MSKQTENSNFSIKTLFIIATAGVVLITILFGRNFTQEKSSKWSVDANISVNSEKNQEITIENAKPTIELRTRIKGDGQVRDGQYLVCIDDCINKYQVNSVVQLEAMPQKNHSFVRWENCPKNNKNICQILAQNKQVIVAIFEADTPVPLSNCPEEMILIPKLTATQIKLPEYLKTGYWNYKLLKKKNAIKNIQPLNAFCIDKRERVANKQSLPMKVSYQEAQDYIKQLSDTEYQIPTIEQWYLALIYNASLKIEKRPNKLTARPVNLPYISDLLGNLQEWTSDNCPYENNNVYAFGQRYDANKLKLPMLECVEKIYKMGFRLVHPRLITN